MRTSLPGPLRGGALLAFFANASDFTRRLTSVKANGKFCHPDAGPDDEWTGVHERLGDVVASLKARYGLDYVYVWHGLPAYWAGVMPGDQENGAAQRRIMFAQPTRYGGGVLEVEPSMAWNPAVLAGVGVVTEPAALYNRMHAYLSAAGVDGVKVDCQAGIGLMGSALGGGAALSRTFHAALESSVASHFRDNHCINCMCHSTENIYRMTGTAVARVSDDFYPRDPASSSPHIAACAYNGLFMGVLTQPDWDMFHSKHASADTHALARAVSGGAVYVSDKPGEHDFELLRRLVLPDGSVLRARHGARPTRDCLLVDVLRDGVSLLKVWNRNAHTGVVGVFHLQGSSWDRTRRKFFVHDAEPDLLSVTVRPVDVEGMVVALEQQAGADADQRYALYTHHTRRLSLVHATDGVNVSLASGKAEAVTVACVLMTPDGAVTFAPLGLVDMYNGGGAVTGVSCGHGDSSSGSSGSGGSMDGGGPPPSFTVGVRGTGRFLCHCSRRPACVSTNSLALAFEYDGDNGSLHVDVPHTPDLAVSLAFVF
ncbi:hypothetical protein FOA52_004063 [Chlamydomonas sp. UWO 241]|nr:hypothetical protein FOA52_004063 [Chlamydomonas sp. UWO 241]